MKQETDKQKIKRLELCLKKTSRFLKKQWEWNDINIWHKPFHVCVENIDLNLKKQRSLK